MYDESELVSESNDSLKDRGCISQKANPSRFMLELLRYHLHIIKTSLRYHIQISFIFELWRYQFEMSTYILWLYKNEYIYIWIYMVVWGVHLMWNSPKWVLVNPGGQKFKKLKATSTSSLDILGSVKERFFCWPKKKSWMHSAEGTARAARLNSSPARGRALERRKRESVR